MIFKKVYGVEVHVSDIYRRNCIHFLLGRKDSSIFLRLDRYDNFMHKLLELLIEKGVQFEEITLDNI